jgi:hypothetical protein
VHFFFQRKGGWFLRAQIEILATLQNVDRQIREKSGVRNVLLQDLHSQESEIETKRTELSQLRGEWAERDKLRREKEQFLQEEGRKAMDKRMRMNRIKNIRELQALQHEVDQIKQSNSQLEEELIGLLEDLEARGAVLREREEELKNLEEAWTQKRKEIESRATEIEREVAEASTARQTIAAQLDHELIQRYELIFSRRGGTAVVTVSGGICQGCFMNIPPQLWNELIKSERLILCPSCHRILYYKAAAPSDKLL